MIIKASFNAKKNYIEKVLNEFANSNLDKYKVPKVTLSFYYIQDTIYFRLADPVSCRAYAKATYNTVTDKVTVESVAIVYDQLAIDIGRQIELYIPNITVEVEDITYESAEKRVL